ncbi:hypothetical protein [Kitasatospora xanthocidica]|uniref:hypothetical protein n=1 Tax=Kitasatospora xanthocidica TaxID=83382 RepID=UPI001672467B|nr:hypothetical protein [Kitasatospora xanthocidica]
MATEDEQASQPDISAMLEDQTSACAPARDAIAAGAEVMIFPRASPHWMVAGITYKRLRHSSRIGLTTLGLDETVEILYRHRDKQLRTGIITAADRSWFYTVYLDAAGTELLACSGVKNEDPRKRPGRQLQP